MGDVGNVSSPSPRTPASPHYADSDDLVRIASPGGMQSDAEVQRWVLEIAAKQATGTYRREYEKTLMLKIAELLADRNRATAAMEVALEQATAARWRASEAEAASASIHAERRCLKEEIERLRMQVEQRDSEIRAYKDRIHEFIFHEQGYGAEVARFAADCDVLRQQLKEKTDCIKALQTANAAMGEDLQEARHQLLETSRRAQDPEDGLAQSELPVEANERIEAGRNLKLEVELLQLTVARDLAERKVVELAQCMTEIKADLEKTSIAKVAAEEREAEQREYNAELQDELSSERSAKEEHSVYAQRMEAEMSNLSAENHELHGRCTDLEADLRSLEDSCREGAVREAAHKERITLLESHLLIATAGETVSRARIGGLEADVAALTASMLGASVREYELETALQETISSRVEAIRLEASERTRADRLDAELIAASREAMHQGALRREEMAKMDMDLFAANMALEQADKQCAAQKAAIAQLEADLALALAARQDAERSEASQRELVTTLHADFTAATTRFQEVEEGRIMQQASGANQFAEFRAAADSDKAVALAQVLVLQGRIESNERSVASLEADRSLLEARLRCLQLEREHMVRWIAAQEDHWHKMSTSACQALNNIRLLQSHSVASCKLQHIVRYAEESDKGSASIEIADQPAAVVSARRELEVSQTALYRFQEMQQRLLSTKSGFAEWDRMESLYADVENKHQALLSQLELEKMQEYERLQADLQATFASQKQQIDQLLSETEASLDQSSTVVYSLQEENIMLGTSHSQMQRRLLDDTGRLAKRVRLLEDELDELQHEFDRQQMLHIEAEGSANRLVLHLQKQIHSAEQEKAEHAIRQHRKLGEQQLEFNERLGQVEATKVFLADECTSAKRRQEEMANQLEVELAALLLWKAATAAVIADRDSERARSRRVEIEADELRCLLHDAKAALQHHATPAEERRVANACEASSVPQAEDPAVMSIVFENMRAESEHLRKTIVSEQARAASLKRELHKAHCKQQTLLDRASRAESQAGSDSGSPPPKQQAPRGLNPVTQKRVWVLEKRIRELEAQAARRTPVSSPAHSGRRSPACVPLLTRSNSAYDDPVVEEVIRRILEEATAQNSLLYDMLGQMDTNENARLSRSELSKGMRRLGIALSKCELDHVFQVFDRDQSEFIDFQEFYVVLTEYRSSMQLAGNSHRAPQAWAHSSPNSSFNAGASSGCVRANSGPEPDRSVHMSGNPLTDAPDAPSRKLEEQVREMEVQLMKSQNEATEAKMELERVELQLKVALATPARVTSLEDALKVALLELERLRQQTARASERLDLLSTFEARAHRLEHELELLRREHNLAATAHKAKVAELERSILHAREEKIAEEALTRFTIVRQLEVTLRTRANQNASEVATQIHTLRAALRAAESRASSAEAECQIASDSYRELKIMHDGCMRRMEAEMERMASGLDRLRTRVTGRKDNNKAFSLLEEIKK